MTHYFKEWTTVRDVLKKFYCLYKNLMLQRDPKTTVPRKKIKAISTPKEQLFRESSCSESHPCANVYNCSSKNFK